MTFALDLLKRFWPVLVIIALLLGAAYGLNSLYDHIYDQGQAAANLAWQDKWDKRDNYDKAAARANENTERAKEQERQLSINKVVESGQQLLDAAQAAATASRASDDSLRATADDLANRLAASQASGNSCTAASSKAAAHAARVLADVFKLADQAAGTMANAADQARVRGATCEQAYYSIGQ
ncbi:DUF2514 family protein [Pseudomonas sp. NA-150]|uniref:DUF2514 family protein n=1 Tax=Pseudomonas sp. NA-150 TaxID=3367525 RepID=UPI0037C974D9